MQCGGMGTYHSVDVRASGRRLVAMGPGVADPPGHCHHHTATMAVDSHCPGCGAELQVPR